MAHGLMSKILGLFLLASRIFPSTQIECASTVTLKYGEMNEVSCKYPLSFLSVRWYRGRDSTPIARIEGGSKSVTQGYDITVTGNLQINQVDVSHAGTYNITVLGVDGRDDTEALNADVTAELTEKPILERCASTRLTLCSGVTEQAKATTLICSAHNTLPAVDFNWYHLMNAQNQTLNSSSSQHIRNETSMLFSSYSTLSYEPNAFTLNIFTCKATGFATSSNVAASSILVVGEVPPQKTTEVIQHAEINAIVKLKCSDSTPLFASWKVEYPNGTVEPLRDIYPDSMSGNCSSGSKCHVEHKATLTVYDVQTWDEAAYECVYFDGDDNGKTIVRLRVIIHPDPYRIVVQGCNDTSHCKLNVETLQGTFKVSVNRAYPSAELLCQVADESKAEVSVFNTESNIVEHLEMGTYDTEVIIEYDIQECVERVLVVCQTPPNTVHESLSALNILLITDATGCSTSNTGLVVGLIIGILIFIVAVSIAAYVILRKGRSKYIPHYHKAETGKDACQLETQHEEEEPLLKGNFDTFFNSFCLKVNTTEEFPAKEFRSLMDYFEKEGEPDEPRVSLVNQIVKAGQPEKVLNIVLRFMARETVHNEDTTKTFCQLVGDLTENKKLSVENFTNIFESLVNEGKISLRDFDSARMRLFQSNTLNYSSKVKLLTGDEEMVKEPYPNILQFVHDLYKKDQCNDNTSLILLHDTLKEYVKTPELLILNTTARDNKKVHEEEMDQEKKQIIEKDQAKSDKEEGNKIKEEDPEIITNDHAKSDREDGNDIKEDSEIIAEDQAKGDGEDSNEIKEDPEKSVETKNSEEDLSERKDVTGVYIQGLLCSVLDDTVNLEKCGQLLESGMDCDKSEILQYKKAYEDSFPKEKKRDGIFWIRFIAKLWDMNVIKDEMKSKFILKIMDTFLMLRDDVKKPLDDLISKPRRKECLKAIEFKDDDIKKRKKKEKGKAENKKHEPTL